MKNRRRFWMVVAALFVVLGGWLAWAALSYPSDRTPEGAYLRVVRAVNEGHAEGFFAYIEEDAQHACYSIRDYRDKARRKILTDYPEPERTKLAASHRREAEAKDGPALFALYAEQRGWLRRLRRDLSGIAAIHRQGARATVETARGTRYAFRRRPNGIWGLTLFTPELVAESEKAARDFKLIAEASRDYRRVRSKGAPGSSPELRGGRTQGR